MYSALFLHTFSRHDIMVTLFHINQLCYVPNPDEKLPKVFFQHHLHHLQITWMFWWPLACHLSLLCSRSEPHALSHRCSFQLELISHRYVCGSMHKSLQQTQKLLGFYAHLCVLTTELFCDHWSFCDSLKQLPRILLPFCLFLRLLSSHNYIFYSFFPIVLSVFLL